MLEEVERENNLTIAICYLEIAKKYFEASFEEEGKRLFQQKTSALLKTTFFEEALTICLNPIYRNFYGPKFEEDTRPLLQDSERCFKWLEASISAGNLGEAVWAMNAAKPFFDPSFEEKSRDFFQQKLLAYLEKMIQEGKFGEVVEILVNPSYKAEQEGTRLLQGSQEQLLAHVAKLASEDKFDKAIWILKNSARFFGPHFEEGSRRFLHQKALTFVEKNIAEAQFYKAIWVTVIYPYYFGPSFEQEARSLFQNSQTKVLAYVEKLLKEGKDANALWILRNATNFFGLRFEEQGRRILSQRLPEKLREIEAWRKDAQETFGSEFSAPAFRPLKYQELSHTLLSSFLSFKAGQEKMQNGQIALVRFTDGLFVLFQGEDRAPITSLTELEKYLEDPRLVKP